MLFWLTFWCILHFVANSTFLYCKKKKKTDNNGTKFIYRFTYITEDFLSYKFDKMIDTFLDILMSKENTGIHKKDLEEKNTTTKKILTT